ncbi:MAG: hypothetical protein JNL58_04330 [Planctomyces sp.]|nr:hypothetical protein [Planctomyces sp.]
MYRIVKWNETFENADTRKRVRLGYFMVPSGSDSAGYIELMSHGHDGVTAFGVFIAICQWSATCPPRVRGTCSRTDGRALTVRQIAAAIRMDVSIVQRSLELLCNEDVGWMQFEEQKPEQIQPSANDLPPSAGNLPLPAENLPQGEGEVKGKGEGKGGKEPADASAAFAAPSGISDFDDSESDPPDKPPTQIAHVVPYEAIRNRFDETFGLASQLTEKRRKALKARWRDSWWRENWEAALERAGPSAFLRGANDRNWVIDFEFFVRPDTVTKMLEGKYDNRKSANHRQAGNTAAAREDRNAAAFAACFAAAQTDDAPGGPE